MEVVFLHTVLLSSDAVLARHIYAVVVRLSVCLSVGLNSEACILSKVANGDRGVTAENMEKSQHTGTDFNADLTALLQGTLALSAVRLRLMKALVWPIATNTRLQKLDTEKE